MSPEKVYHSNSVIIRNVTIIEHHKQIYRHYTFYCLLENISNSNAYKQKHKKHKTGDTTSYPIYRREILNQIIVYNTFRIQSFKIILYCHFVLICS